MKYLKPLLKNLSEIPALLLRNGCGIATALAYKGDSLSLLHNTSVYFSLGEGDDHESDAKGERKPRIPSSRNGCNPLPDEAFELSESGKSGRAESSTSLHQGQ